MYHRQLYRIYIISYIHTQVYFCSTTYTVYTHIELLHSWVGLCGPGWWEGCTIHKRARGYPFFFRSAQLPGSTWLFGPSPNLQQSKRKHFCFNSGHQSCRQAVPNVVVWLCSRPSKSFRKTAHVFPLVETMPIPGMILTWCWSCLKGGFCSPRDFAGSISLCINRDPCVVEVYKWQRLLFSNISRREPGYLCGISSTGIHSYYVFEYWGSRASLQQTVYYILRATFKVQKQNW